jgi:hypothetical protein
MKFKLLKQESGKADNTALRGYLESTREQLVELFGEPHPTESIDGKITTRWIIEFADKTVATIYDYKRYAHGAPKDDELYAWHIGGRDHRAWENVTAAWIAAYTVTNSL